MSVTREQMRAAEFDDVVAAEVERAIEAETDRAELDQIVDLALDVYLNSDGDEDGFIDPHGNIIGIIDDIARNEHAIVGEHLRLSAGEDSVLAAIAASTGDADPWALWRDFGWDCTNGVALELARNDATPEPLLRKIAEHYDHGDAPREVAEAAWETLDRVHGADEDETA